MAAQGGKCIRPVARTVFKNTGGAVMRGQSAIPGFKIDPQAGSRMETEKPLGMKIVAFSQSSCRGDCGQWALAQTIRLASVQDYEYSLHRSVVDDQPGNLPHAERINCLCPVACILVVREDKPVGSLFPARHWCPVAQECEKRCFWCYV